MLQYNISRFEPSFGLPSNPSKKCYSVAANVLLKAAVGLEMVQRERPTLLVNENGNVGKCEKKQIGNPNGKGEWRIDEEERNCGSK